MNENRNVKAKIWLYAVILFTSAFIVLLMTAYSQIKLNRSIDDYKNQINSQESEKNKVKMSFASAQELNSKLQEKISQLEGELQKLKEETEQKEKSRQEALDQNEKILQAYSALGSLHKEYFNGNILECASYFKRGLDISLLDEKSQSNYNLLKAIVYKEAGEQLYEEGYVLYKKRDYSLAAEKLSLSASYAPDQEYSDDNLYYLAYSVYKNGDKGKAVEIMKLLLEKYPSTTFIRDAKRFISRYSK